MYQRQETGVEVEVSETVSVGKEFKSTNANCNSER